MASRLSAEGFGDHPNVKVVGLGPHLGALSHSLLVGRVPLLK